MNKPCNKCDLAYSYKTASGQTRYDYPRWGKNWEQCYNCEKHKKYERYLESQRQYRIGVAVKNVEEYFSLIKNGESFFYWRGAIRHYKVLECLQFRTFVDLINNGYICRAVKKEDKNAI